MEKINFFFIILLLPYLSGCGDVKFDPSLIAEPPSIEDAIVDKAREYCNAPHYYVLGAKNPNWCFLWDSYPYGDSTNSKQINCFHCVGAFRCIYPAFDCSGLTQWVYKNNARQNIDIAESAAAQYDCKDSNGNVSSKCSQYLTSERKKGDLIFMYYGDSTVYCASCFHVGIYVGKDQTVYWKYPGNYFARKIFYSQLFIQGVSVEPREWNVCEYDFTGTLIGCSMQYVYDVKYVGETIINAGKSLDRYNTLEEPCPKGSVQEVPYAYLLGSNTDPKDCRGILCFELRYNNKAIARPGF